VAQTLHPSSFCLYLPFPLIQLPKKLLGQGPVSEITIDAADDIFILDSAEYADVHLPFEMGCRMGGCTVCAAKLLSGTIPHEADQLMIDENATLMMEPVLGTGCSHT
jgi:ferredoxin